MSGKKRSRQQMIDALRNADLNSTFPFLDLPPELRNMIFGQVLEGDGVGFEVRYGELRDRVNAPFAILASCKQVYHEAHTLAYEKFSFPLLVTNGHDARSIELLFNLRHIGTLEAVTNGRKWKPVEIQWPSLLAKITCLTIEVCIKTPTTDIRGFLNGVGTGVNHALYELHQHLCKRANIQCLQINIKLQLHLAQHHVRDLVCPLTALAGAKESVGFKFTGRVPDSLQNSIRETAAAFRTLRGMKQETERVTAIRTKLRLYGSWCDSIEDRYETLMHSKLREGIHVFASETKLKRAILKFEALFEDTKKYGTDNTEEDKEENTEPVEGGLDMC